MNKCDIHLIVFIFDYHLVTFDASLVLNILQYFYIHTLGEYMILSKGEDMTTLRSELLLVKTVVLFILFLATSWATGSKHFVDALCYTPISNE